MRVLQLLEMEVNNTEIFFSIITQKEEGDKKFLRIALESGFIKDVDVEIFFNKISTLTSSQSTLGIPQKGISTDLTEENRDLTDYTGIFNLILTAEEITHQNINSNCDITINSEMADILELPWEKLFENSVIYRKYKLKKELNSSHLTKTLTEKIAILMSHSYKGLGKDISSRMEEEVQKIFKLMVNNREPHNPKNNLLLIRHTTRNILERTDLRKYNLLHIISHGDAVGDIVLEKNEPQEYKEIDILEKHCFVKYLEKCNFELIYLSLCRSSGGEFICKPSLAYLLISKGVTKYCIAYRDGIGEETAIFFAEQFYERMFMGKTIKDSYKEAVKSFRDNKRDPNYLPFLFLNT